MREIKFRAWGKILKKFVPVWSVIETRGDNVVRGINKNIVIDQYTGLKDFNRVEIYEGDILKDVDNGNIVGYVEYDDAFGEYYCGDNNLYECTRDCQVVGNIHEQPELLKEK
ncbi:YopX family protein [Leuconostoc citreum]|uniref:YopX family protein n=1 Tax=Leuconostoc citreum TaxID=33964 RepID=UPI002009F25F|nr:YopX family protein [Leuconostoc citreum]MCK8605154.1 YopX family protein [Leuconostoc citreum]